MCKPRLYFTFFLYSSHSWWWWQQWYTHESHSSNHIPTLLNKSKKHHEWSMTAPKTMALLPASSAPHAAIPYQVSPICLGVIFWQLHALWCLPVFQRNLLATHWREEFCFRFQFKDMFLFFLKKKYDNQLVLRYNESYNCMEDIEFCNSTLMSIFNIL